MQLQTHPLSQATVSKDFGLRRIRSNQAEDSFQKAVAAANKGDHGRALEYGREALYHARFHSARLHIDAHALMANLLLDTAQYERARIHCWEATALLNPADYRYAEDREFFDALEKFVNGRCRQEDNNEAALQAA